MKSIIVYLKSTPLLPLAKSIKNLLVKRHPLQTMGTLPGYNLKYLGSEYGGWTFLNEPGLENSTIISAGLGEDASFDIEFAKEFNAEVILVDPTPRAIEHYNQISGRLGMKNTTNYTTNGNQPIESYDLSDIKGPQLELMPKALWNEKTTLKFFAPPNPDHVSHSISNFRNNYKENTRYIEIEAITLIDLIEQMGLKGKNIPLVKLDIEGAEIEVIDHFLSEGFLPSQILVEFDELLKPSKRAFSRVNAVDETLKKKGYKCIHTNGRADFLYILDQTTD